MNPDQPAKDAVDVAIGVVRRGDAFLVGLRGPDSPLPGLAEFPGGKCAPDEPPEVCVVRECLEETGLRVAVVRLRQTTRHAYPHGELRMFIFDCEPLDDAPPRLPFIWRQRAELALLPFPEANATVIRELLRETVA
jgi:8-oxo-dGTP diphosphatase